MRKGTFGLSRKCRIGHVRIGDRVVCCAGKGDWKIIGLGSAISDYYVDDAKIFLKEGYYPDRFDFKIEALPKNREVDLMSIIGDLSFVKNLSCWAVFFRDGMAKMSKSDWDLICEKSDTAKSAK